MKKETNKKVSLLSVLKEFRDSSDKFKVEILSQAIILVEEFGTPSEIAIANLMNYTLSESVEEIDIRNDLFIKKII